MAHVFELLSSRAEVTWHAWLSQQPFTTTTHLHRLTDSTLVDEPTQTRTLTHCNCQDNVLTNLWKCFTFVQNGIRRARTCTITHSDDINQCACGATGLCDHYHGLLSVHTQDDKNSPGRAGEQKVIELYLVVGV